MKLIIRFLITAFLVAILSYLMKGVQVDGLFTALIVALVLGFLNVFVKPVLVLFTLPVTIFTLGLFYLVINAVMIMVCDKLVDGFEVHSFWTALWFSLMLSLSQSIVYKLTDND